MAIIGQWREKNEGKEGKWVPSPTVHMLSVVHSILLHAREVQSLLARNNNRNYVLIDLIVTLCPSLLSIGDHVLLKSTLLAYTDVTLKARRVPESSSTHTNHTISHVGLNHCHTLSPLTRVYFSEIGATVGVEKSSLNAMGTQHHDVCRWQ